MAELDENETAEKIIPYSNNVLFANFFNFITNCSILFS